MSIKEIKSSTALGDNYFSASEALANGFATRIVRNKKTTKKRKKTI